MSATPDMRVNLGGISLPGPVLLASGTAGYGEELEQVLADGGIGGIIVKSITLEPRDGNPPPRIVETPSGMLNAIGLANIGVDAFINDKLPFLRSLKIPVIVNVAGFAIDDYVETARRVSDQQGIAGIELNISCPNVKKGGMEFGVEPGPAEEITRKVKAVVKQPLIVKLSPNVTDIAAMAQAVKNGGADAVAVINTYVGMVIDIEKRKPVLKNGVGGLSGPAIRPLAVRCVWQVRKKVDIPILGLGGIMDGNNAMEFILAGASAVAVGTGTFLDPNAGARVTAGIAEYLKRTGTGSLKELVGKAHQAGA